MYANTHMMPEEKVYTNPIWAHLNDWKTVLAPFYEKALFMLGSMKYKKENPEDDVLKAVAREMGREYTYGRVDYVGVYLGNPEKEETDPYFNGLGPKRKGCIECAGCMVGCRYNAKNTLDKNYLWFAENTFGAKVIAETVVEKIIPTENGYRIQTKSSTGFFSKQQEEFKSKGVVVSGGVLGTLDLLLKQKYVHKTLPNLSDKLGTNVLTNSEMLSGVTAANQKLNYGLAISSVFNPDDNTHIELCKFPDGSGAMLRLATMAAGNGSPLIRTAKMVGNMIAHPWDSLRALFNFKTAYNSVVLLIMQTLPNSMKMKMQRGIFGWRLKFDNSSREKVPSYIPIGQEVLHRYAKKVNGGASNAATEVLFGLSSTAHILGGCPMGKTAQEGVIDQFFKAYGYSDFYILDGSVVPCNLGVNPSLTITALSEYAISNIPNKEGSAGKTLDERMKESTDKSR